MPKAFSEKEREEINTALLDAAMDSMRRAGVRKTTVDALVRSARIPKGTFYLFYESKELLLYAAIMREHDRIQPQIAEKLLALAEEPDAENVTDTICSAFDYVEQAGLQGLVTSGEMEVLMRKLPDELVREHQSGDDEFVALLKALFPAMTQEDIRTYSGAFRALFFSACYRREVGEDVFDGALRRCVRGLVLQMMDGEKEETRDE